MIGIERHAQEKKTEKRKYEKIMKKKVSSESR